MINSSICVIPWNEPEKTYLFDPLKLYVIDKADPTMDPFRRYLEDVWLKKHPGLTWLVSGLPVTKTRVEAFPRWFKGYLSTVTGKDIEEVTVLKKMIHFNDAGMPIVLKSDTVLHNP